MPHRYEVTLHVSGLSAPVEGSERVKGAYVIRWIEADSPQDAADRATVALRNEEKFQSLVRETEKNLGQSGAVGIEAEAVVRVSWFKWRFWRRPSGYIYYVDDDTD